MNSLFLVIPSLMLFALDNGKASLDLNDWRFESLVADALEHLWDFCYLGKHPLSKLKTVQRRLTQQANSSHLDKGRVVSEVLRTAIETIKPTEDQLNFSREKHYYTILIKAYVEGIANKTIARSISVGERTLYRYSIKAIQAVAQILRDWEAGVA